MLTSAGLAFRRLAGTADHLACCTATLTIVQTQATTGPDARRRLREGAQASVPENWERRGGQGATGALYGGGGPSPARRVALGSSLPSGSELEPGNPVLDNCSLARLHYAYCANSTADMATATAAAGGAGPNGAKGGL